MSFFKHRLTEKMLSYYKSDRNQAQKLKDDYRYFRKSWAAAVADPRAKSKVVACDQWIRNDHGTWRHSKGTGRCKQHGWIESSHMVLFNLIRGKPLDRGFAPITNPRKLKSVYTPWQHFNDAVDELDRMVELAQKYTTNPVRNHHDYHELTRVMDFLEPFRTSTFQGTITIMDLANIDRSYFQTIRIFISKKFL